MKTGKGWIIDRLKRTMYNALSLSFMTWAAILVCYYANGQAVDLNFLLFTAAVIGIKKFARPSGETKEGDR
ncbi:MAG: hypothetical protein A2Y33_12270 [Spirochaetes bacterium GWF1_51_8]|nr:MAG: hypothetical protein A2Y33_12270 [Spirochaetes bacterium GWF1_51_8]